MRVIHALIEGLVFQRLLTPDLVPDEVFRAAFGALAKKASVRLDDRFADRETESEAALRTFGPCLMKLLENAAFLAGRESGSVITHGDFERTLCDGRADLDRGAGGRVSRRILQKIRKHLLEHHFIAGHQRKILRKMQ